MIAKWLNCTYKIQGIYDDLSIVHTCMVLAFSSLHHWLSTNIQTNNDTKTVSTVLLEILKGKIFDEPLMKHQISLVKNLYYTVVANGQYTSNTMKPRYFFHTKYNLEILFALKSSMYCDIGNFMISTITNDTLRFYYLYYVSKYFSSLINCQIGQILITVWQYTVIPGYFDTAHYYYMVIV